MKQINQKQNSKTIKTIALKKNATGVLTKKAFQLCFPAVPVRLTEQMLLF